MIADTFDMKVFGRKYRDDCQQFAIELPIGGSLNFSSRE